MKLLKMLCLTGCVCSVAVAAAAHPVYAQEWIGSESESIGTFNDDNNDVYQNFENLMEDLSDSGLDLFSPSPSGFDGFEDDQESDQDDQEDNLQDFIPVQSPLVVEDNSSVVDIESNLSNDDDDYIIDPLANYNTYYGSIGTTYLEYMRGFLPKLGFSDHYVAARTSQYDYIFAYGDLEYTGALFRGNNITVLRWNTYNTGTYYYGVESSFNLNPSGYMVYSDLSDFYPSLADSAGFTSRQILILLIIMGLVWTIDHMYQVRKIRRLK